VTRIDLTLLTPAARRVIAVITTAGGRPMLSGGFVRDALLAPGTRPKDTDMEVYGITDPDQLAGPLATAGFRVMEAGKLFGVLKVRAGGEDIDVSLPRRESRFGAGHRGFVVIQDGAMGFAEAAARRDFTVNALMADPGTGEVLDFHGGLADLEAGVLRHTSPAFAEDPLRVLRAVQFAARYGFSLDAGTAMLCRQMAARFPELATERVYGELSKLARQGTRISHALAVLEDTGWEIWFPELAAMRGTPQEPAWHPEGDVWIHAGLAGDQAARLAGEAGLHVDAREVAVLAALLHDAGKPYVTRVEHARIVSHGHAKAGIAPARSFLRRTGFGREVTAEILPLIAEHMNCGTAPTEPAVRRMARRLAPSDMGMLALIIAADCKGRGDPGAEHAFAGTWLEMARTVRVSAKPAPGILRGQHLIDAGLVPGPAFGQILARALAAQDDGAFGDEAGALAWLAAELAA
jgi:tRNA nucleotidyltransferase (CCA-adding enzyme)